MRTNDTHKRTLNYSQLQKKKGGVGREKNMKENVVALDVKCLLMNP